MDATMLHRFSAICWLLLMFSAALLVTGCDGCRSSPLVKRNEKTPDIDELEKKKKEKEKVKEDFEFKPPVVVPGDSEDTRSFVKPGHWVTARHVVKANNFDFQADLYSAATDSTGKVLEVENTPFEAVFARPAPLPKGQDKIFETTYFIPVIKQTDDMMTRSVWLHRELRAARGGRLVKEDVRQGTVAIPLYQYYFVVLTNEPAQYGYLKALNAVASPTSSEVDSDKLNYYRVNIPKIDRFAPLPNHLLTWTSIAYVLWDDVGPQVLTPAQQVALVDWLHFGGQLIISGPNSLEKLRGSYLDPYLPAKAGETIELSTSAVDAMNDYWSLQELKSKEVQRIQVPPGKPLLGVELTPLGDAAPVPYTGELVWERRIGNGRIVTTAFSLTDPRILNWKSLDSFFNGAILRRPRRRFEAKEFIPDTVFADFHPTLSHDSRVSSTLRFFSRDIGVFSSQGEPLLSDEDGKPLGFDASTFDTMPLGAMGNPARRGLMAQRYAAQHNISRPMTQDIHPNVDDWHFRGFWSGWRTSMAAWNDRSGAANAARQSLKDAAGISIPKGEFVLKVLAAYLVILAPLNWLLFRLLGRVEWAWISAPVIAMVGTFAVVRLAQLDIGFARSLTEIAIVEAFRDYPRAHATRFSALYTSLSTSYDLEFADDGAVALPFAATDYTRGLHDSVYTVTMRRDKQLKLSGFLVPSNKTGTVHCEQVVDLGGPFSLTGDESRGWQLQNGSKFNLEDVGILRKNADGTVETAWLGKVRGKATLPFKFTAAQNNQPYLPQWKESPETISYEVQVRELLSRLDTDKNGTISRREARNDPAVWEDFGRIDQAGPSGPDQQWGWEELVRWSRQSRAGAVSLGQLWELASKGLRLLPGEVRLIGWTAEEIPGVVIQPSAAQAVRRTMFLVHLEPGKLPPPLPDVNLLSDVDTVRPEIDPVPNSADPDSLLPAIPSPTAPRLP